MNSADKNQTDLQKLFSDKRYFVNNLDSYHGSYILKELGKILDTEIEVSTPRTTESVAGEHAVEPPPPPTVPRFEIIGTVTDPSIEKIDKVARIVPKTSCLPHMLTCGWVVLDISCDPEEVTIAMDYIKLLKNHFDNLGEPATDDDISNEKRYFILISTVMTWACTKPIDPDTPEMSFVETDFRKRKTHINYKAHYDCENEVVAIARKYRSQVGATVVCAGATYGGREETLFYWFQKAWEGEPLLPILGRGNNAVPLIDVKDLAQIVYNLLMDFPRKLYILAVEINITKQREIVKPLGRIVGAGMFKCIPLEDAFLIPEMTQKAFDLMSCNLHMEPVYIIETMGLQISELAFAEHVPVLIKEFKKERGLKSFKLVMYGPPIVGKTTVAKAISEQYGLVYVSPQTVIKDITDDLVWRVEQWKLGETSALPKTEGEEEEVENDEDVDAAEEEEVRNSAKQNLELLRSGRPVSAEDLLGFIRQRLLNNASMNRGWVLDGYPTSISQCSALFEKGEEEDDEEQNPEEQEKDEDEQFEEDLNLYDDILRKLLPDIVVSLVATDEFVCEKAMRQPEGSQINEEHFLEGLKIFRMADGRDITPLNFFDELGIHPLVVPINDHYDYGMSKAIAEVSLRMGRPCRYPKLMALIEAAEKKEKRELETLKDKAEKAHKELEKRMQEEREDKMEYWSELQGLLREEEEAALGAAGEPLRNYLVQYIFPSLTPALLEVAKLRPDDPIDYLAEYLFKKNPTGKMLEPGYNMQAEILLGKVKLLDDTLRSLDIKIDSLLPHEAECHESVPKQKPKNQTCLH